MAKSFKIATNEFINKTLGGKLKTADKTLQYPLKCPTYDELKRGVNFVYTDGTTLGIQWRGTVNGEDYTGEYDPDRCLAEIDIEKLNSHDFKIYTNSGHTKTSMSADCMTTAEDISGKTRYEADRLNENFIYPVYSQSGDVKWHEYDDSDENIKQKTVTVNLSEHGSWTTYSKNPDSTSYNAYMSTTHADNGYDLMTISLSTGFTDFTIYIRSYAETIYDYTIAGKMDTDTPTSNTDTGNSKANTNGKQNSDTAITNYLEVEYTGIDSSKEHTIWVMYSKDGGSNYGDDRGYVLIPKSQNNDYIIKEGKGIGDLNVASITHSGAVPTSSCTLTYKNEKGNVDTIKERWDVSSKKYTLIGKYKELKSNTVNITQRGETYGYYADSAHTQWVSANTLSNDIYLSNYYTSQGTGAYLTNSGLNDFYANLHAQNGWLNDFGDNSGTTNGRDEYNIDTQNYSSGTSLIWGGETNVNVVNAKKDFDNNNSDIMGETIPSADTNNNNTYHMAFSNDMWYSGTTLPTTIDNKHDFYWIFLDENIEHLFYNKCYEKSQSLRGDKNTTNANYLISYYRRYFKPLHCYGKTSIDRMYKYGTTTYDKGTTNLKWLQGKYPKHFKRAVLELNTRIDPYDTNSYTTEINKLKLNSHVIMLEEQNNWTYSASTKVKAISGSNNYSTVASTSDESYTFRPRFIMMSPEQYSADTNGVFGQIVSGQELSYNEHISGDSYDYNIKKDNPNNITKESTDTPFVSYSGTFTSTIDCYTYWPSERFYFPVITLLNYDKKVRGGKLHYIASDMNTHYIYIIYSFKDFIEKDIKSEAWENLSQHTGYTYTYDDGYKSNAIQYPTGTTNGISFTNESIQEGNYSNDYNYEHITSYTYTLTSNTTINDYVVKPGTILKINYSDGPNIETEIVGNTGTTIEVNTRIDTRRIITSIEYTAMTNYEYAIYNTTYDDVSVNFATFTGLNFDAYDPNDSTDVPYYSIEKKDSTNDFTGSTKSLGNKSYETGKIDLIKEMRRELKVYLNNRSNIDFIFEIRQNYAYKYDDYENFIKSIKDNEYIKSINKKDNNGNYLYWIEDAWDDSKKYVDFD